jgi:hypothetical protein
MLALKTHLLNIVEPCELWSVRVYASSPARYELCYLMRVDARRWRLMPVCSVIPCAIALDQPDALERDLGGMIDELTNLEYAHDGVPTQ